MNEYAGRNKFSFFREAYANIKLCLKQKGFIVDVMVFTLYV